MPVAEQDLLENVIKPALECLHEHNPLAAGLLCAMARNASDLEPLHQSAQGIGLYQITSEQHRRTWDEYVAHDSDLASRLRGLASQRQFLKNPDAELQFNLVYATAIAWLLYKMNTTTPANCINPPMLQSAPVQVAR